MPKKKDKTEWEKQFNCGFIDLLPKHTLAIKAAMTESTISGNDKPLSNAIYAALEEGRRYGATRTEHLREVFKK
jgi:hypothetical protein